MSAYLLRFVLLLLVVAASACVTVRQSTTATQPAAGLAIMQGVTGNDYTQVLVLTRGARDFRFALIDAQGKELPPAEVEVSKHQGSFWRMQRVVFHQLTPSTVYQLRVWQRDKLLDERRLSTLNPQQNTVRFAIASCMDDHKPQGDIWQQMLALRPDVIFLIGDNSYADKYIEGIPYGEKSGRVMASPSELWGRYVETRNYIDLFRSKDLVPVVATWDDHDYGVNNGGSDYPYKRESLATFNAFFASQPSKHYQRAGLGTAALFSMYGFNFFLLDNRTFRTVDKQAKQQYHYGEAQLQWLWRNLRGKDYAMLLGGDQFFGGYHRFDSFEGKHREAFTRFLAKLKTLPTKVAFFSGDRHITEIMRISDAQLGYQTYEFTSSPVHGKLYPGDWGKVPNPRQIAAGDLKNNFMLLELSRPQDKLRLQATSYTHGGKQLFSGDYTVR